MTKKLTLSDVFVISENGRKTNFKSINIFKDDDGKTSATFSTIYLPNHEYTFAYYPDTDEWVCDAIECGEWITYVGNEAKEEAKVFGLPSVEHYLKTTANEL